jgi:serine/threonine protein kinase
VKVFIQGKNQVDLTNKDLLDQGGEGSVYVKNGTAFKVYFDPKKCIPVGKVQELSSIINPSIIKPDDILLDNKNNPIGYTMRYVSNTIALCKTFTKSFKNRNGVTPQNTIDLVRKLQDIVTDVHKAKVLIVDLNELNFLVSNKLNEIYAIDVDSYQTKSYPATAIMENIRDRSVKNNKFTEGSDWFSFAIIAFNMLIGIHPYKGKHPIINDWGIRMDQNISIFDPQVTLPKVCLPFDVIPNNYLQWFKAVLQDGKRIPPPVGLQDVIDVAIQIKKVIGSNNFDIKELFSAPSDITTLIWGSVKAILTQNNGAIINGKDSPEVPADARMVSLPKRNTVLAAYKGIDSSMQQVIKLFNVTTRSALNWNAAGTDLMCYDNRLYVKNSTAIYELKFTEAGNNIIPSMKQVAQCLEHGTNIFEGVVFQNLLGATYVSFFPEADKHYQLHIKELDQYRIIDAKFEKGVLIVIGYTNGKYDKIIFRLSSTFTEYDNRKIEDVTYSGINFTVLDNKICVHLTEDEKLQLFPSVRNQSQIKEIDDPNLSGDMKLFSYGIQTMFWQGNKVFSIKMK